MIFIADSFDIFDKFSHSMRFSKDFQKYLLRYRLLQGKLPAIAAGVR